MTGELRCLPPEAMGFDPAGWKRVTTLAGQLCAEEVAPVLALQVVHAGRTTGPLLFASPAAEGPFAIRQDPIFLVASLTKPILAMGVVQLAEQGLLALNDRVVDFLPEFAGADRRNVTVRHLLTHTSGLPDMLPDNMALRREQAPLSRFIAGTCEVPLDFPPGRGVQYQSMGYALLGEIISRVSGQPYNEYLRDALFEPLGMYDTALGTPDSWWQAGENQAVKVERIRRNPRSSRTGRGRRLELEQSLLAVVWCSLGGPAFDTDGPGDPLPDDVAGGPVRRRPGPLIGRGCSGDTEPAGCLPRSVRSGPSHAELGIRLADELVGPLGGVL